MVISDIGTGMLLGALFMTRHITLVSIPVFGLGVADAEAERKEETRFRDPEGHSGSGLYGSRVCAWVLMCRPAMIWIQRNHPDLEIASKTNPKQLTMKRLLMVAGFYLCYFAPDSGTGFRLGGKSIRALHVNFKEWFCSYNRLWTMVCGSAAAFFVAVTRHSWRAYYNYPEFEKIERTGT